jgi:acetyl esterase/lipase
MVAHLYNPPAYPYASPLLLESFRGLPPTFFMFSGLDPLHDEGVLYAKLLERDG